MAWNTEQKAALLEALRGAAGDAGQCLNGAFGDSFAVQAAAEPLELTTNEAWSGPGLVIHWVLAGGECLLLLIPEIEGLLPEWYRAPDESQQSRLATLAQELGMALLPATVELKSFRAEGVARLEASFRDLEADEGAVQITIPVERNGERGRMFLVGPFTAGQVQSAPATAETTAKGLEVDPPKHHADVRRLPNYMRSLLRIRVPVRVTLATAKQPLRKILELGPGAILQFEKSCEDTLDLYLGEHRIGVGEAVKVGDKFGLRITSITLPAERFRVVRRTV